MNRDTSKTARWLRLAAASTEPPRRLATAGQIWWRAEIARRLDAEEREAERAPGPLRLTKWVVAAVLGCLLPIALALAAVPLADLSRSPFAALGLTAFLVAPSLLLVSLGALWFAARDT